MLPWIAMSPCASSHVLASNGPVAVPKALRSGGGGCRGRARQAARPRRMASRNGHVAPCSRRAWGLNGASSHTPAAIRESSPRPCGRPRRGSRTRRKAPGDRRKVVPHSAAGTRHGSTACWDLCGGHRATGVPTATRPTDSVRPTTSVLPVPVAGKIGASALGALLERPDRPPSSHHWRATPPRPVLPPNPPCGERLRAARAAPWGDHLLQGYRRSAPTRAASPEVCAMMLARSGSRASDGRRPGSFEWRARLPGAVMRSSQVPDLSPSAPPHNGDRWLAATVPAPRRRQDQQRMKQPLGPARASPDLSQRVPA